MPRSSQLAGLALLLSGLALAGCSDPAKAPAQAALAAAEASLGGLSAEVERAAPEQAKAAKDGLATARVAAAQGDWKGALAAAGPVAPLVERAVAVARTREAEVARAWEEARHDLPNLIFAIEDRLDLLDGQRSLPKGLDRPALAAAHAELSRLQDTWAELESRGTAGDPAATLAGAEALRTRALSLIERVGLH